MNSTSAASVTLGVEAIEEVDDFTHLVKVVDTHGWSEADVVKTRIGKARVAFLQLKNIWNYSALSLKNKIRIFNKNVKAVLLYGAETWRATVTTTKWMKTFGNSCQRIPTIHQ